MTKKKLEQMLEKLTKDTNNGYDIKNDYFIIYMGTLSEDVEDEYNFDKDTTEEDILDNIQGVCNAYDVDEHFDLWYRAGRGEPESPAELLRHCEYLQESYDDLNKKCIEYRRSK